MQENFIMLRPFFSQKLKKTRPLISDFSSKNVMISVEMSGSSLSCGMEGGWQQRRIGGGGQESTKSEPKGKISRWVMGGQHAEWPMASEHSGAPRPCCFARLTQQQHVETEFSTSINWFPTQPETLPASPGRRLPGVLPPISVYSSTIMSWQQAVTVTNNRRKP